METHQPFNTVGEQGYLNLLQHILDNGYTSNKERTGTGTLVSPTPHQLHFPNVGEQFPLFTTKYVSFNMLACEMLWFISGSTNANDLREIGSDAMADMWMKWADEDGELGPVYGYNWRNWRYKTYFGSNGIDQLSEAIDKINDNPESRRIIVTAWKPQFIGEREPEPSDVTMPMKLPPCHLMYQFTCEPLSGERRLDLATMEQIKSLKNESKSMSDGYYADILGLPEYRLHLHLTMRSIDMMLGAPFNIAQYSLLLLMVAQVTNTIPGDFTWTGINCHIYQNHIDAVKEQLPRDIKEPPMVVIQDEDHMIETIDDFTIDNLDLCKYHHYPKIQAEVSV